jgi:GH25 family lysozyme M1 (1,4-beta-N-acetylmuramidase)
MLTLGMDVARYLAGMDWRQAAYAGIKFAFIKFTDGSKIVDPQCSYHWFHSGELGIIRSPYHFYRNDDAGTQASNFHTAYLLQSLDTPLEMPPMIDVEIDPIDWNNLALFLAKIKALFNVPSLIIYTSRRYWTKVNGWEKQHDLFQAEWNYDRVPTPVNGFNPWVFRQFSGNAVGFPFGAPASCKEIDLDVFDGTIEELKQRYGIK